jgi:uncharacterized protein (TIGR03083 family)
MTDSEENTPPPAQLPMVPDRVRDAARDELRRVERFVHALSADEWAKPSAVAGWRIGDVVAHINLGIGIFTRLLPDAGGAKSRGGMWKTVGEMTRNMAPAMAPAFHAVNNAIPKVIDRTMSRDQIKTQFSANAARLETKLDAITPGDFSKEINYVAGPWPLSFFLAAMVNELSVHGWDIESTLDPQARLTFDARTVLPWFYWSGTPFMFRPPSGASGRVQLRITDPDIEMWWRVAGRTSEQGMGSSENADAGISGDSGTAVLALAGRIKALDIVRFQLLETTGNAELARTFLGSWRIV